MTTKEDNFYPYPLIKTESKHISLNHRIYKVIRAKNYVVYQLGISTVPHDEVMNNLINRFSVLRGSLRIFVNDKEVWNKVFLTKEKKERTINHNIDFLSIKNRKTKFIYKNIKECIELTGLVRGTILSQLRKPMGYFVFVDENGRTISHPSKQLSHD